MKVNGQGEKGEKGGCPGPTRGLLVDEIPLHSQSQSISRTLQRSKNSTLALLQRLDSRHML